MTRKEYRDSMLMAWETAQKLSDHVDSFAIDDYHQIENRIDTLVVDLITNAQESGLLSITEAKEELAFCAKLSRAVHFACLSRIAWEYHYTQVFRAE